MSESDTGTQALVEILMGASHADGKLQIEEEALVKKILAEVLGEEPLPKAVLKQIEDFEPDTFELADACSRLEIKTPAQRRQLLKVVAEVTEIDDVLDLDESHFIRRVARCIGAGPEEYSDLTVEVSSAPEGESVPPPKPEG